jgi:hypothetical protein
VWLYFDMMTNVGALRTGLEDWFGYIPAARVLRHTRTVEAHRSTADQDAAVSEAVIWTGFGSACMTVSAVFTPIYPFLLAGSSIFTLTGEAP